MHEIHDRILTILKMRGPLAIGAIAKAIGFTIPGARKHLATLLHDGLLTVSEHAGGVGRPKQVWQLTAKGPRSGFPTRTRRLRLS